MQKLKLDCIKKENMQTSISYPVITHPNPSYPFNDTRLVINKSIGSIVIEVIKMIAISLTLSALPPLISVYILYGHL